jgi:DNA-binding PadR family transcriptional regulator
MSTSSGVSESKILDELNERVIKSFLDIVVMTKLKSETLSGYDFIAFINKRFNMLISAGTVYSLLYALERKQLIEGSGEERRRVYKLTEKGKTTIDVILKENRQIEGFMANILKPL